MLVEWDDVPAADQNGIITRYTISYQSLTQNHNDSVTVNYPERQANLTGLKKFVNYSITVFASTDVGPGPASKPIFVVTDEDSKFFSLFDSAGLVCLLLQITLELKC